MSRETARIGWLLVAATIVAAWLVPFPYFEALNNPNENARVYMTRAIVEQGTFAIDDIQQEWGYVNDKATFNGRLFAGKAPGASFLAVPAYFVHYRVSRAIEHTPTRREIVWVCRMAASILPLLAFLLVFARASRRWIDDVGTRQLLVLGVGIGSTVFSYGLIFASHAGIAAAIFTSLILFERHRERPGVRWYSVASGFLLGAAICMEYPAALGVLVVALWSTARSPKRIEWVVGNVLGALLPIGLLMLFHHRAFGGVMETPYAHLENPEFQQSHSAGFFGMERVQRASLIGSFVAPSNGLFFFAPWTALATLGLLVSVRVKRLRESALVTAAVFVVYTVFISMVDNWRGGWTAGPRYIVPLVPFAAWYLANLAAWWRERESWPWFVVALSATVAAACVACGVSAVVFPHYPTEVANPVFELGVFMPAHGYVPHTLTGIAGLGSNGAALALVAGLLVATWLAATWRAGGPGLLQAASVTTLAVCAAFWLVRAGEMAHTDDSRALYEARTTITNVWEPRRTPVTGALHQGALPSEVVVPSSPASLTSAARDAARDGFDMTALDLIRAASSFHRDGRPMRSVTGPSLFNGPLPSDEGSGDR